MPVRSGFEATALIRKHEMEHGLDTTPIIALTAHAMIGYRVPISILFHCTDWLGKMFGSGNERVSHQTTRQETSSINGPSMRNHNTRPPSQSRACHRRDSRF